MIKINGAVICDSGLALSRDGAREESTCGDGKRGRRDREVKVKDRKRPYGVNPPARAAEGHLVAAVEGGGEAGDHGRRVVDRQHPFAAPSREKARAAPSVEDGEGGGAG